MNAVPDCCGRLRKCNLFHVGLLQRHQKADTTTFGNLIVCRLLGTLQTKFELLDSLFRYLGMQAGGDFSISPLGGRCVHDMNDLQDIHVEY